MAEEASMCTALLYAVALLVFGSLNTLTMKGQLESVSEGLSGQPHRFQKPWFGALNVFFACLMVLVYDCLSQGIRFRGGLSFGTKPLLEDAPELKNSAENDGSATLAGKRSYWSKVLLVSIPASIDVLATGMSCIGMLYVPASVWQMLKGAMIIFAAIFAVAFLGRRMHAFNWLGVGICIVGVAVVGVASILGGGASKEGSSSDGGTPSAAEQRAAMAFGIIILLLGQVLQAAQMVLEEWLMKEVHLPGLQVIGWEGAWGFLMIMLVVYPLLWVLPGPDDGHMEDPFDTWAMMQHSTPLTTLVLVYTVSCAAYNVAGIGVTGALSAVHRVLIEASRTVVVWSFGLFMHYRVDPTSTFGEEWTPYSYLQLLGFVLLLAGQATYGGLLRWPCLRYPEEEAAAEEWTSPSAALNLISPLAAERGRADSTASAEKPGSESVAL